MVGLGLVPKYVPKEELGFVLCVGGGLPLTILLIPFTKFLARYMAQGEYGKVKALLRDMFVLTAIIFVVVSAGVRLTTMIFLPTLGLSEYFVIRLRLSDIESAGHYMGSQFAEIVFPLVQTSRRYCSRWSANGCDWRTDSSTFGESARNDTDADTPKTRKYMQSKMDCKTTINALLFSA